MSTWTSSGGLAPLLPILALSGLGACAFARGPGAALTRDEGRVLAVGFVAAVLCANGRAA